MCLAPNILLMLIERSYVLVSVVSQGKCFGGVIINGGYSLKVSPLTWGLKANGNIYGLGFSMNTHMLN